MDFPTFDSFTTIPICVGGMSVLISKTCNVMVYSFAVINLFSFLFYFIPTSSLNGVSLLTVW